MSTYSNTLKRREPTVLKRCRGKALSVVCSKLWNRLLCIFGKARLFPHLEKVLQTYLFMKEYSLSSDLPYKLGAHLVIKKWTLQRSPVFYCYCFCARSQNANGSTKCQVSHIVGLLHTQKSTCESLASLA